jgi:hypothetical protein
MSIKKGDKTLDNGQDFGIMTNDNNNKRRK